MGLSTLLLIGCVGTPMAARSGAAAPSGQPPMRAAAVRQAEQMSEATRIALLVAVWEARADFIGDQAVVDRRSVHQLLDARSELDSRLPSSIRTALYGDTIAYEHWPDRPARLRLWGIFRMQQPATDSAVVIARLSMGHREHLERYALAFADGRWQVRQVELYGVTWYGAQSVRSSGRPPLITQTVSREAPEQC